MTDNQITIVPHYRNVDEYETVHRFSKVIDGHKIFFTVTEYYEAGKRTSIESYHSTIKSYVMGIAEEDFELLEKCKKVLRDKTLWVTEMYA
jgi:hypothetical protein